MDSQISIDSSRSLSEDETRSSLDKILEQKCIIAHLNGMVSLYKNYNCVLQLLEQIQLHESCDYLETLLLHATIENDDPKSLEQLLHSGIDVYSIFNDGTPLEHAIHRNNLDSLHVILYFGGYQFITNKFGVTPLTYSMLYASTAIQRILLGYEENVNGTFEIVPMLCDAIEMKSPLISDIIEMGDVNYFFGSLNVISVSLCDDCPSEYFKVLWQKFDYNIWKQSFSKCVLLYFVVETTYCDKRWRRDILNFLLENEEKLKLDIEYHNNSDFWESESLITNIFYTCLELDMDYDFTHACILLLLSHGAWIFKSDIDMIYFIVKSHQLKSDIDNIYFTSKYSQLANVLLFMDFYDSEDSGGLYSWMYFKYTLQPDPYEFVCHCGLYSHIMNPMVFIDELKHFYYFDEEMRNLISDFETDEIIKTTIIKECEKFPSLLELSREAARNSLCKYYRIKDVSLFYTILKSLNLPSCVKELLTFQRYVYKKN